MPCPLLVLVAALLIVTIAPAAEAQSDQAVSSSAPAAQEEPEPEDLVGRGAFQPGSGFTVAKGKYGQLNIGGYFQVRYLNQLPDAKTAVDHTNTTTLLDGRNDFALQKVTLSFNGWVYTPRLTYASFVWMSGSIQGQAGAVQVSSSLTFRLHERFALSGGVAALPGIRSNMNIWPLFMSSDRRMAEEYFKPGYSQGLWAEGKLARGLFYKAELANNLNAFGIDAGQLDRTLDTVGASLTWMPTTGEFGPRNGSYGDFEHHDALATLFAVRYTHSTEERFSQPLTSSFENSVIRLSDGTLLFQRGALAPDVTIDRARYQLMSLDAGFKRKGYALNAEYYARRLDNFESDAPLSIGSLVDHGLTVQLSEIPVPKRLELYQATSFVHGKYGTPWEVVAGANLFPFGVRLVRLNGEVLYVKRSAVGSLATPYLGKMTGPVAHATIEVIF